MPTPDCVRRDEHDCRAPIAPDSTQDDPEEPIARLPRRTLGGASHRGELLPQRQIFQHQFLMSAERQRKPASDDHEQHQHAAIAAGVGANFKWTSFGEGQVLAWSLYEVSEV